MRYFDYAATTPMDPEALQVYIEAATHFYGNTSSLHDTGDKAAQLLQECRNTLAGLLGVASEGIYFTSGGTEANHLGILSLALENRHRGRHIITGIAEHSSVHSAMGFLKEQGFEITSLPFNSDGMISLEDLEKSIRHDTILVSIAHANGEIGSIQNIKNIARTCKNEGILLHTDMVQSFGKKDISELAPLVDSLAVSSHKIYGPKGVGAVYIHPRHTARSIFPNQTHEGGLRGGTVNTPGIAAFISAAESACSGFQTAEYQELRDLLINGIKAHLQDSVMILEAPQENQMPHVIGLCIKGLQGQWAMLECNRRGFAISTGSACQTGKQALSKTVSALGLPEEAGKEFIRISMGKGTTKEDVTELVKALSDIAEKHYEQ
ncbi:aminotransferase class V-fold PLP-dependent enzyme [Rossellomorea vietnamensis]|uniref:Aminotransferase class V-fold PLP-dependent enzyme n=1 Tax=Rossellomorea vietnamensis TaxID=218284 RepID=A0A5D4P0N1_9BACI|nr:IscS subfamily cysteine desulfurase [Rossellomorea vietnamensis]TYS19609.1 aminotransferase class V-fold PLP-dependent enzyme [Rossellomorea vietnamensis]